MVELSLTKEQILSMEAGPEMDALVAERVMDYRRCVMPRHAIAWAMPGAGLGDALGAYPAWLTGPWRGVAEFTPSTSIAAAWEVIERLRERGTLEIVDYGLEGWGVYYEPRAGVGCFNAQAATAPLAICTVALLTTLEDR